MQKIGIAVFRDLIVSQISPSRTYNFQRFTLNGRAKQEAFLCLRKYADLFLFKLKVQVLKVCVVFLSSSAWSDKVHCLQT